jgi:hypothetical protein
MKPVPFDQLVLDYLGETSQGSGKDQRKCELLEAEVRGAAKVLGLDYNGWEVARVFRAMEKRLEQTGRVSR